MSPETETRLELDFKNLPVGVIPKLREMAETKGMKIGPVLRAHICELAIKGETHGEAAHSR